MSSIAASAAAAAALMLAVTVSANAATDERSKALESLVKAEQDFANMVRFTGMRQAFLEYADAGAILFRPGAVSAHEWLAAQTPTPGILSWTPIYADISAAGDLGWTTGPWEFAANKMERSRSFGQYVSVWRRQPDGAWRYLIDAGTGNFKPIGKPEPVRYSTAPARSASPPHPASPAECESALLSFERALADSSRTRGARATLGGHVATDARMLRHDHLPRLGSTGVADALPGPRDTMTWEPARAVVAKGCDLAFTYGRYSMRPGGASAFAPEDGEYLRIWRRAADGGWLLALDLTSPRRSR